MVAIESIIARGALSLDVHPDNNPNAIVGRMHFMVGGNANCCID